MHMEIYERLALAREQRGYATAADAADALGIPRPTYFGHENGARGFKLDSAIRYASFFRCNLSWLLTGKGDAEAFSITAEQIGEIIPVKGVVKAGAFADTTITPETFAPIYQTPDPSYPQNAQFAVIVQGESMNKVMQPNDKLLCVSLDLANLEAVDNDLVIVERTKYDGELVETTVKRLRVINDEAYELWPESNHPDFQEPIRIPDPLTPAHVKVKILAKVVKMIRDL